jgi:hypothetical protein
MSGSAQSLKIALQVVDMSEDVKVAKRKYDTYYMFARTVVPFGMKNPR